MQKYIIRRLLLAIPTLLGAATVIFFAPRLAPGDAVDVLARGIHAESPEQREEILDGVREDLGLGGNVFVEYGEFLGRLVQGDLGESILNGRSVASEVATRLPRTLEMALIALVGGTLVGIPAGVLSALHQNSFIDYVTRSWAVIALSVPSFWLAILFVVGASVWFAWSPPLQYHSIFSSPSANLSLILPAALVLAFAETGAIVRVARTQTLEVMSEDYVKTARAKGLSNYTVTVRHVMRNAMLPMVTLIGLRVPTLAAGALTLEIIFGIPGIARYAITSLDNRDFPGLRGSVMAIAVIVIVTNLVVDLSYGWLDPRLRYG